jgi:hypothetical protein
MRASAIAGELAAARYRCREAPKRRGTWFSAGGVVVSTVARGVRWQNNSGMTIFIATVTVFAALLVVLLVVRKSRQS